MSSEQDTRLCVGCRESFPVAELAANTLEPLCKECYLEAVADQGVEKYYAK